MTRTVDEYRIEIGLSPLTAALAAAANILVVFGVFTLALGASTHPRLPLTVAAWVVLLLVVIGHAAARRLRWRLPAWAFPAVAGALAVVLVLDAVASWGAAGVYPSAAVAAGSVLLIVATADRPRELFIGATVIGVVVALIVVSQPHDSLLNLAPDLITVALAVIPPLVGIAVVRAFRLLVRRELDRVQTKAMVTAPRFSVGMLTSEELARLDLDAERLLDGVATGRYPLPLPADTATSAAALATQLRLHLVDGRRETWLHHALAESAFLGPAATLTDPHFLAGLLDSRQRNALLSAVWLLVGDDPARAASSIRISLSEIERFGSSVTKVVRVRVEAEGIRANRLDGETWKALNAIGSHVETGPGRDLRVDIDCEVDSTVD